MGYHFHPLTNPPARAEDCHAEQSAPRPDAIRKQLARIAASAEFRSSLRLQNFLKYVIETTLKGEGDRIKGYTIGVEALGRDSNFDPQTDPIVRVEAGRLRLALDRYYAKASADDPVVIELPRGGYVPTFQYRKLPVGLTTPPFSRRRALYHTAQRRARLVALIAFVALGVSVALDVAMAVWQRSNEKAAAMAAGRVNSSGQWDHAPLPVLYVKPVGVSGTPLPTSPSSIMFRERMIDALARFDDVTVLAEPPRSDPAATGGPVNAPAPTSDYDLASAAHYYPDGSVSFAIRTTDESDNVVVWSNTYEGVIPEPLQSHRRVVRDVTMSLLQPFGVIQSREGVKRASVDSMKDPYRCVLDSHEYLRSFDLRQYAPVRACLEQATEKSPSWVSPFVQLARIDVRAYQFGLGGQPGERPALDRACDAANRAIELKPTSASACNALQDLLLARGDTVGARIAGETALRLNRYDRVVVFGHAFFLVLLGETEEGLALMHQVTIDNPVMPARFHFIMALAAYLEGDLAAASAEANQTTTEVYPPSLILRVIVAAKLGDRARVRRAVTQFDAAYPDWRANLRANIGRFFPDAAMADRIAGDFASASVELTQ
jgi:hypothetical protein